MILVIKNNLKLEDKQKISLKFIVLKIDIKILILMIKCKFFIINFID